MFLFLVGKRNLQKMSLFCRNECATHKKWNLSAEICRELEFILSKQGLGDFEKQKQAGMWGFRVGKQKNCGNQISDIAIHTLARTPNTSACESMQWLFAPFLESVSEIGTRSSCVTFFEKRTTTTTRKRHCFAELAKLQENRLHLKKLSPGDRSLACPVLIKSAFENRKVEEMKLRWTLRQPVISLTFLWFSFVAFTRTGTIASLIMAHFPAHRALTCFGGQWTIPPQPLGSSFYLLINHKKKTKDCV